jgi:hypothetical protein
VLEAGIRCIANRPGAQAGLVARCSTTSPLVGYRAFYLGGSNAWYLCKDAGGTSSQLGTWAETLNDGDQRLVQVKVEEDAVSVLIDGALRISVTDDSIPAAGRGAVEVNDGSATDGFHIDYFQYRQLKEALISDGTGNGHNGTLCGEFTLGVDGFAEGEGAAMISPVPEKGGWGFIRSYMPFVSGSNRTFVGIVRHRPPHPKVRSPQMWFGGAGLASDPQTHLPLLEAVYEGDDGGFTRVHWISQLQARTFYGATIWYHVLPIDEWIHYALTVVDNGTLQTAELFVNGASKGTGAAVPNQSTWHANSGTYVIGNRGQGSGQLATAHSTDGWLGCQAVFNRILSPSEIGELASVVASRSGR